MTVIANAATTPIDIDDVANSKPKVVGSSTDLLAGVGSKKGRHQITVAAAWVSELTKRAPDATNGGGAIRRRYPEVCTLAPPFEFYVT
jgi:hypothetical protein